MELIQIAGTCMILASSAWTGLHAALRIQRTQRELEELRGALELMYNEVEFAGTPAAALCARGGQGIGGPVGTFLRGLETGLGSGAAATEGLTRRTAGAAGLLLPEPGLRALERLFDGFGRYDREGQLRQLRLALGELEREERELRAHAQGKTRTYALLGLCAGAAVLVLVI